MYSILHETDAATSINSSVWGRFLPGNGKQLATAGSKYLKFYRLNLYCHDMATGTLPSSSATPKLECMLSFTMMAPIRGIAVIRLEESDSLALTFDDAKLSIVNINPATMTLNTLSLHSIEDDFLRDGYAKDSHHPELCADPKSRCCAFTVYGRHLAIVPLQRTSSRSNRNAELPGKDGRQIMLQSYTVKLRSLDERLENVLDMCFMHGYYEPTLLFLFEPIQTTAGRASVRYDTICILGVSLNLKDRAHAVVWNFSGLPMTVSRCLPILQPVGGICLFGANEVVYLNQSVPARGISLNSCADEFSRFPLAEHHQQMRITLDGCAAQTIPANPNDVVVVSRTGEGYILTLEADQANVVRDMHLTKTFETSIPCALTVCSPNLLFLASHLGDSQLLQFSWEKRKHSDDLNNSFYEEHSRILFDEDDVYLYGDEFCKNFVMQQAMTQVFRSYKFELVDSLPNIGPCKWLRTSNPSYISDEFRKNPRDIYFDMITASGHGKDSSLCFFHRSIRPQIVTGHHFEGSQRIWTIGRRRDGTHKFLVISRERGTLVMELGGNDMVELDDGGHCFCLTESTIAAGDMADGQILVQDEQPTIKREPTEQQMEEADDIEEFLYGNAENAGRHEGQNPRMADGGQIGCGKRGNSQEEENGGMEGINGGVEDPAKIEPSYWLFLVRENGNLYIYSVPELQLVYMVRKFSQAHEVLYNDAKSASYPFRKIPIGQTVHQVVFMLQPDLIALVTSEKRPNKTVCTVVNEEKQVETHDRDENFILPTIDA